MTTLEHQKVRLVNVASLSLPLAWPSYSFLIVLAITGASLNMRAWQSLRYDHLE